MALLDRNSLSGAVRFHKQAQKSGVRAIIGAEVVAAEGFRYALLAESRQGYQNLCRLLTKIKLRTGHGDQESATATAADVAEHAAGLVCLTGDSEQVERMVQIFGPRNVFVELQRHYDRDEEHRNQAAIAIARKLQLPLLATNGVSHAMEDERDLLEALTCVRHKTTIFEAGKLLSKNAERHLKSAAQMCQLFADLPEAIANTQNLAARLTFTLCDLGYQFPAYPVPPGETMNSYLRQLADAGARKRYRPYYEKAQRQIERELAMIEKLDLAGYFLIVWDIVRFCKEQGLLVQGRGSAANSAVCYALEITAVDPVGMDLLFERFLSEERGEWPDIDLDLASGDERERAIQYVYQRYGQLGAAMTANVITYRGRSAARDIGKVLGFDEETLGRIAKVVPHWGFHDKSDTAEHQFNEAGVDLKEPLVQKFLSLYERVQDLPRHLGQHSGGMVICQGQLDSIVPLQPATMPGRFVVQWDKEDCADMGIVKVDLLGLGMMAVMKESIGLIRDHYGEEVDLAHLPPDDPQVYAALQKADTIGMFQVESRAQMSFLPGMRPNQVLRHRGAGGHHPPGSHCRKDAAPVSAAAPGAGGSRVSTSSFAAGARTYSRRAVISRAAPAHGHDRRRIQRRASRRVAPGHGIQAFGKTHAGNRSQTARGHDSQPHCRRCPGSDRALHRILRGLRLPRIARGQLRAAGLCQRLFEVPLPGRFHRRHAEQSAHGLLSSGNAGQGCAAPRPALQAYRCDAFRMEVHAEGGPGGRGPGARGRGPAGERGALLSPASAWASTISKVCAARLPRAIIEERTRTPFASIRDLVGACPTSARKN